MQTQKNLPEITKTVINDEYYESDGRNGKKPPELKAHKRVMALLDFGDRRAIYDFSHAQYFSLIRSERFAVKGTAGEILGDKGYMLRGESEIPFELMPIYSGTDCSLHAPELDKIVCDGEVLFKIRLRAAVSAKKKSRWRCGLNCQPSFTTKAKRFTPRARAQSTRR